MRVISMGLITRVLYSDVWNKLSYTRVNGPTKQRSRAISMGLTQQYIYSCGPTKWNSRVLVSGGADAAEFVNRSMVDSEW